MSATPQMQTEPWKRELVIAAVLFGIGFLVLPLAIYWVGSQLIGEYAPEANALTLAEHIWTDLLQLEPFAWLLVLSPYAVLQIARLTRRIWRTRSL
jgi:hypothetical protein